MKNQQQKFLIRFTYLDDKGVRRTKKHVYPGTTINEASKKLHWQYRSATELEILKWEIVKEL